MFGRKARYFVTGIDSISKKDINLMIIFERMSKLNGGKRVAESSSNGPIRGFVCNLLQEEKLYKLFVKKNKNFSVILVNRYLLKTFLSLVETFLFCQWLSSYLSI